MTRLDQRIAAVTDRIIERSKLSRKRYLDPMAEEAEHGLERPRLSCGNFALGFAAAGDDKEAIHHLSGPNLAIVTAYNDMLPGVSDASRIMKRLSLGLDRLKFFGTWIARAGETDLAAIAERARAAAALRPHD